MAFTVNPRGMDVRRWTAQMQLSLQAYGPVPALLADDGWRDWARTVTNFPGIAAVGAPRPDGFHAWQDWAVQFNLAIRNLSASP